MGVSQVPCFSPGDSDVQDIYLLNAFNHHNHAKIWLMEAKMNVEPLLLTRLPGHCSAWNSQLKP